MPSASVPRADKMTRQSPWHDEHNVDARSVDVWPETREQQISRTRNAPFRSGIDRGCGGGDVGTGLHLDKDERTAATGNKIDLTDRSADAAGQNAITLQPQPPCGQGFGAPAARLGHATRHWPFSSSART